MNLPESSLRSIALALVADSKGILAADESLPSIEKRFKSIGIPSTEENRRAYREMLFEAEGIAENINGVILFDETMRQKASDGTPFAEVLQRQGLIPGIKVDKGTKPLALTENELIAEGLDNLRERLQEYRELGAKFAKWRCAIRIGPNIPSIGCVNANAHILARYAALCQEENILPIIEPEVEMNGDHSIERCFEVTELTLRRVFAELHEQRVVPEDVLLKTNMVLPGKEHPQQSSPAEIADFTLRCFARSVPASIPGIVFLSGGQSENQATANLNAIIARAASYPWKLSFSFGRALQDSALKSWKGEQNNVAEARKAFIHRAKLNSLAQSGLYTDAMERGAAA
jgi:fructose-bisphosphate aldolase, class I